MKLSLAIILLSVLYSAVTAKFYVEELNPSKHLNEMKDQVEGINLLRSVTLVPKSHEKEVPSSSDERELEASEEAPMNWNITNIILREKHTINCYSRKLLSMICTNTCVGAIEFGCGETGCENKRKMKEFCSLPCKLTYNMYK